MQNTSEDSPIRIRGRDIPTSIESWPLEKLKYFSQNPRILSLLTNTILEGDRLQEYLDEKMQEEKSVHNLKKDIKRHGGLIEEILVLNSTKEVIEGNSRLAAYRALARSNPQDKQWMSIRCRIVSDLTEEEVDAYLGQLHLRGKTQWDVYEKAHLVYKRVNQEGHSVQEISDRLGLKKPHIKKLVSIIEVMKGNADTKKSNYSFYQLLYTNQKIKGKFLSDPAFQHLILMQIKEYGEYGNEGLPGKKDSRYFTSLQMRDCLPIIIDSRKEYKKYVSGKKTIHDAYESARQESSNLQKRLSHFHDGLASISKKEIERLEEKEFNKCQIVFRRLAKETNRLKALFSE